MKKPLAVRGMKNLQQDRKSVREHSRRFSFYSKADPSVIAPYMLLSGLYTASIPAGFDAG
jgi:hypothetical protein